MSKLIAKILYKMLFSICWYIYIINNKIENDYIVFYSPRYFAKLHELLDSTKNPIFFIYLILLK